MTKTEKVLMKNSTKGFSGLNEERKLQRKLFEVVNDEAFLSIFHHLEAQDKNYHEEQSLRFEKISQTIKAS